MEIQKICNCSILLVLEERQRMRKQNEYKNVIITVAIFMRNSFLCMKCCLFIWFINQTGEDYNECISWTGLAISEIYLPHFDKISSMRKMFIYFHYLFKWLHFNNCTLVIDRAAPQKVKHAHLAHWKLILFTNDQKEQITKAREA